MPRWSKATKAYRKVSQDEARAEKTQREKEHEEKRLAVREAATKLSAFLKSRDGKDAFALLRASGRTVKIIDSKDMLVLQMNSGGICTRNSQTRARAIVSFFVRETGKPASELLTTLYSKLDEIADEAPKK